MNNPLAGPARVVLCAMLSLTAFPVSADDRSDVEAATGKWIDAFNRKSSRDIVALYAPDAVFFGTSSPVLRDSPELVRDYFKDLSNLGIAGAALRAAPAIVQS